MDDLNYAFLGVCATGILEKRLSSLLPLNKLELV